ncbi:MAG: hypothetical protein QHI48_01200 [Bacteroidota bacterium]|nr:hypothetical protein [Bacteroidota bacterium]
MRAIIANEFFIPGTLEFHPEITMDQECTLFQLLYATSILVLICYLVVLVSAVMTLRTLPLRVKENGWLLMAALLFFLFLPVEAFTGYLDVKFILLWRKTLTAIQAQGLQVYAEFSGAMRETLSHRIGALGGLPVIATLCYFTAIAVIVFKPLRTVLHGDETCGMPREHEGALAGES